MRRRWWILLAVAVVIIAAVPAVLYWRVRAAERAWAESYGDLEQLAASFRTTQNGTAEMIPQWVASLGMDPRRGALVTPVDPEPEVLTEVYEYLKNEEESASAYPGEPPARVARYVQRRAAALNALAESALQNPPPSWDNPPMRLDASIPNFLPIINLQKVLTGSALVRAAAGDQRGAERLLVASWRINEEVRARRELIGQLVAIAILRMQLTAIRKVPVDPAEWLPRLREHDHRASLLKSYALQEAWSREVFVRTNAYASSEYIQLQRDFDRDTGGGGLYTFRPRWRIYLTTPIRWLDLPALMEGAREVTVYASTAPILDAETDDLQAAYDRGFSRWFYIREADMTPEKILGAFRRNDRALTEMELTEKVLMARAARAANRGRWPDSIAGFGSTRIRDGEWIYERDGKGIRIRFSRELHWPKAPPDVPLEYASER